MQAHEVNLLSVSLCVPRRREVRISRHVKNKPFVMCPNAIRNQDIPLMRHGPHRKRRVQ
jgi:hypothetical protein